MGTAFWQRSNLRVTDLHNWIRNTEFSDLDTTNQDIHYSSLVCDSLTPWGRSGLFYYPRYPESWRGTAASTPALRREYYYWTNPARYYRHRTYYPRYLPRYRSRYYR